MINLCLKKLIILYHLLRINLRVLGKYHKIYQIFDKPLVMYRYIQKNIIFNKNLKIKIMNIIVLMNYLNKLSIFQTIKINPKIMLINYKEVFQET
jgi:hypothetical protein